jgi:hypothetical protein
MVFGYVAGVITLFLPPARKLSSVLIFDEFLAENSSNRKSLTCRFKLVYNRSMFWFRKRVCML